MSVFVRSAGFLTTVQDLGRRGYRQSGVSVGGALDPFALRVANTMVGNEDSAAGLEVTFGKLHLRFQDRRVVAWCGGPFDVHIGSEIIPAGRATVVLPDEEFVMNAPKSGARAWFAISGGIDVPPVLGSRSTDLRGNFGGYEGRPLRDQDSLSLGNAPPSDKRSDDFLRNGRIAEWTAPTSWVATSPADRRILRIVRGPNWSLFSKETPARLVGEPFTVMPDSDRMGARLDGPDLKRLDDVGLISEAVAPGTLQVPPNGKPILLLGDCQTIGGYPKIAHVISVDLPITAQLWPGDLARFQEVSLEDAHELLLEREKDFALFRTGLELRRS
jgi:antagonist of KipI